jgi:hypothetical protein
MTTADGTVKGVTKIVDHGADSQHWNLVLLSEGYRSNELGNYHTHAQNLVNELRLIPAVDTAWNAINIHRVDVESTESGADDPKEYEVNGDSRCKGGAGTSARTYFDATFCGEDRVLRRRLTVNNNTAINVANDKVPRWHEILVIVNSAIYGGSGGGAVATYSLAPGAQHIGLHELGHSAFSLADEYESREGCIYDEPLQNKYKGREPGEPNVTTNTDLRTIKWRHFIDASRVVPIMLNPDCSKCDPRPSPVTAGTVGAFEGAFEFHCGCFRPEFNCKMRVKTEPFCAVCQDRILRVLSLYLPWFALGQRLSLAESGSLAAVKWAGENIQVFAFDRKPAGAHGELIYNQLYHMWTEPHPYDWNKNPPGWQALGQKLPFAGRPVAVKWAGENIQVFAFTNTAGPVHAPPASQQLYHMWTEPHPYDWNKNPPVWQRLGQKLPVKSGPVAVKWAGENIQVFAIGTDNQLYHIDWNKNPPVWQALGQKLRFSGGLAAVEWAGDNIQVFAFAEGGQLYHMWTEPDPYGWDKKPPVWQRLGQKLPVKSGPVAVKWAGENIQVFAIGTDNQLYHLWTAPHPYDWGNNGQWAALGQQLSFAGGLAAVEWAGDNIQVFAFDRQRIGWRPEFIYNQLYHMWTEPHPYRWNRGGWIPLGWKLPFAGDLAAVKWAGKNVQVFAFTNTAGQQAPAGQPLYHMWTEPDPYHWM